MNESPTLELSEIASSARPLPERAQEMLDGLCRLLPCDAAWLALADPVSSTYSSLASTNLDEGTLHYLSGPRMGRDIEMTQTDRRRPPLSPSDLPYPAGELATWAECLIPAGFHEALAVGLFTTEHRHVGFLALLSVSAKPPTPALRRRLQRLTPVVARGIDPWRSLIMSAQVVNGATAGVVVLRGAVTQPLPGLEHDELLADGSPLVSTARGRLRDGQVYTSFLWPHSGRYTLHGHLRVTVLASSEEAGGSVLGAIVLTPVTDLRGLTPRELEVMGWVIEGHSNQQIARALAVTARTVAAHLEHILAKFDAPTRTLAAIRAEREGLYVPPPVPVVTDRSA